MNQTKSSAELKRQAKIQLSGKYSIVITALLIPSALSLLATMPLSFIMPLSISLNSDTRILSSYLLYYGILTIIQLILGVFATGNARLYLNIACNRPYQVSDVFYGFKFQPNKSILILLLNLLFQFLCAVPFYITIIVYVITKSYWVFPFMALAAIFTIISSVIVSLMFSQAFFVLVDLPHYSAWELMKISARIMKGHKGRLFYLQISFFGLILLGICSCYIGLLWVSPYMTATYTNFYLDLMASQKRKTREDTTVCSPQDYAI